MLFTQQPPHLRPRPLFCLLLIIFSLGLAAQSGPNGKISGQLIDAETTDPIGFANVVIYTVTTDSMVGGTTTDIDGRFLIQQLPLGEYKLQMSFLGYETMEQDFAITQVQSFVKTGQIELGAGGQDLEEVVVTADRAVMELGLDRKVFNVEKQVAAAGGSATDLLRQLPSIVVDVDGNVSLRGSGNVRFLINGRPSGLVGADPVTYLNSLSSTAIERIEVITNPGAAFDPEGTAGLINIVLKRKRDDGFNATANVNVGTNNKFDGSLDVNWRKGKFNTFAGISGRYDERWFRGFRDQTGSLEGEEFSRFFTFDGDRVRESVNLRLGTEYTVGKRGVFGIQGNVQLQEGQSNNDRVTEAFDNEGVLTERRLRMETEPSEENEFEIRTDYTTTFKKEGRKLTIAAQYSGENEDETENYRETITSFLTRPSGEEFVNQRAPSMETEDVFLAQADYEQLMGDFKFETGWRTTITDLTTDAAFGNVLADGTFEQFDDQSNLFGYEEDIHAVYATIGGTVDKITFSAGLRAEQAYTTSTLFEPDFEVFENDYFKVYPSVFLGYAFDDNTTVQGSYSRRINRPRAWALNPFVDRGDPFNLRSGNPFLLPELINSFELNVQQRYGIGTITAGVYFRQLNDLISRISIDQGDGVTLNTRDNLDQGRDYGIEVIMSARPTKKLDLTLSANGYRSQVIGTANDASVDADGYLFSGNLQASYNLPWDVDAQATYFYRSPGVRPQGRIETIQSLDLGFRKSIIDGRGALTLRVTDIFNTRKYRFFTDLGTLQTDSQFQRESRIAYVGFQYSLQQLKPERRRGGRGGGGGGDDDF